MLDQIAKRSQEGKAQFEVFRDFAIGERRVAFNALNIALANFILIS
jgi:hypothetical protein